jgi:hypothetical protein
MLALLSVCACQRRRSVAIEQALLTQSAISRLLSSLCNGW